MRPVKGLTAYQYRLGFFSERFDTGLLVRRGGTLRPSVGLGVEKVTGVYNKMGPSQRERRKGEILLRNEEGTQIQ